MNPDTFLPNWMASGAAEKWQQVMEHLKIKKLPAPPKSHLFIGGPVNGQRLETQGKYLFEIMLPAPQPAFSTSIDYSKMLPSMEIQTHVYFRREVHIGTHFIEIYVYDSPAVNEDDVWAAIADLVMYPKEPVFPEPKATPQGVRITVDGKTLEWKLDDPQVAGILAWAQQSLGAGKEVS